MHSNSSWTDYQDRFRSLEFPYFVYCGYKTNRWTLMKLFKKFQMENEKNDSKDSIYYDFRNHLLSNEYFLNYIEEEFI